VKALPTGQRAWPSGRATISGCAFAWAMLAGVVLASGSLATSLAPNCTIRLLHLSREEVERDESGERGARLSVVLEARGPKGELLRGLRAGDFRLELSNLQPDLYHTRLVRTSAQPGKVTVVFVVPVSGMPSGTYERSIRPVAVSLAQAIATEVPNAEFAVLCAGREVRVALTPYPGASVVGPSIPLVPQGSHKPVVLDALARAHEMVSEAGPGRVIVVFDTGQSGPTGPGVSDLATQFMREGASMFVVSCGTGQDTAALSDQTGLAALALATGGRVFDAADPPRQLAAAIANAVACRYEFEIDIEPTGLTDLRPRSELRVLLQSPSWFGQATYRVPMAQGTPWLILTIVVGALLLIIVGAVAAAAPQIISAEPASAHATIGTNTAGPAPASSSAPSERESEQCETWIGG